MCIGTSNTQAVPDRARSDVFRAGVLGAAKAGELTGVATSWVVKVMLAWDSVAGQAVVASRADLREVSSK